MLVEFISEANKNMTKVHLIVKKHPTEPPGFLREVWLRLGSNCNILEDYSPKRLIQASDFVLGMTSMFLLEANAMRKQVALISTSDNYYRKNMEKDNLLVVNNLSELKDFIFKAY